MGASRGLDLEGSWPEGGLSEIRIALRGEHPQPNDEVLTLQVVAVGQAPRRNACMTARIAAVGYRLRL